MEEVFQEPQPSGHMDEQDLYYAQLYILENVCAVCQNPLASEENRIKYWFECGHIFDSECINSLCLHTAKNNYNKCPTCRNEFDRGSSGFLIVIGKNGEMRTFKPGSLTTKSGFGELFECLKST